MLAAEVFEVRASSDSCSVEMMIEWIVDDADRRPQLVGKAKGDGDVGMTMNEVHCAINRVAYECWIISQSFIDVRFLSYEFVLRVFAL